MPAHWTIHGKVMIRASRIRVGRLLHRCPVLERRPSRPPDLPTAEGPLPRHRSGSSARSDLRPGRITLGRTRCPGGEWFGFARGCAGMARRWRLGRCPRGPPPVYSPPSRPEQPVGHPLRIDGCGPDPPAGPFFSALVHELTYAVRYRGSCAMPSCSPLIIAAISARSSWRGQVRCGLPASAVKPCSSGQKRGKRRPRMQFHVQSTRGLCRSRLDDHRCEASPAHGVRSTACPAPDSQRDRTAGSASGAGRCCACPG